MKGPNREEQKRLVKLWDTVGPELERISREELKGMPYRWQDVVALLDLGEGVPMPEDAGSGMIEMQRAFMKHPVYQKPRKPRRRESSED